MTAKKYVYDFAEGNARMRSLLGGKGANLAEMTGLGIPVPQGFTVTTEACVYYSKNGRVPRRSDRRDGRASASALESLTGKRLGDPSNPLLLSVRSGAVFSMPGMMDTVLNLGLNDETVEGMAKLTGNPRFAYDSYRRFISMFGDVVMGVDPQKFEDVLTAKKQEAGAALDTDLTAEDLRDLTVRFKAVLEKELGEQFPNDAIKQMHMATVAVFNSWNTHRAKVYRRQEGIPDDLGTAVNLQSMVFGNKGETSGTGVAFTRNPSTGENYFYGEFLMNAQGEDVVAGVRHPRPLEETEGGHARGSPAAVRHPRAPRGALPRYAGHGVHHRGHQALHAADSQRQAHGPGGSLRIAVDMVNEGLITKDEALMRVDPAHLDQLLHPGLDPKAKYDVLTTGLGASPGAAVGQVVFTRDEAEERGSRATRSSWCVGRPTPTTSTGSSTRRASSPATAV